MKNLLLTALLLSTMGVTAFAEGARKTHSVPVNIFEFAFKNKTSTVSWNENKDFIKATFLSGDTKMVAVYTADGELIGTGKEASPGELTAAAKKSIDKSYEGFTITETIALNGQRGNICLISARNEKGSVVATIDENNGIAVIK